MFGFKCSVLLKQLALACDIDVFSYNLSQDDCPVALLDQMVQSVKFMRQQSPVACLEVFDVERARKARSRIELLLMNTQYLIGIYRKSRLAGICFLLRGKHSDAYQFSFAIRLCVFPDFQGNGLSHELIRHAFNICLGIGSCRLTAIIRYDNWASRSLFEIWRIKTLNRPSMCSHEMMQHRMYIFTRFETVALPKPVINPIRIEQFFRNLDSNKTTPQLFRLERKFKSKDWLIHGWTDLQLGIISSHMGHSLNLLMIT